jgi:hypothetical protein
MSVSGVLAGRDGRDSAAAGSTGQRNVARASLGAVGLCLTLWIRAKTVDQEERGNAERRAIFVGLWPPMLWLLGDTVREFEKG